MIQIQDISYQYDKKSAKVFDELSLSFDEGKIYGLLGKNGVGKSTLLYLLCGLLHPRSGNIFIDGQEPRHREPQLLENLFFVPDEVAMPHTTLRRYVSLYAPFYPRFSEDVLKSCLADFEMDMDARLDALSLGQKKRVMVSFALATQCRVLLMDEPTNGLDIPAKSLFRKMVARHTQEDQIIIISTHQVHDVDSLLDHIIVLSEPTAENGQKSVLFDASMADVQEKFAFLYRSAADDEGEVLYSEPTPQGRAVIVANSDGRETTVNLEMLFKAVVQGKVKG
ncbi:MAG: ABC transporter ATP-binding protein [Prevotella sp.]|nr:ABC transporter ATP-binding protein [Prevotella sp.]